MLDSRAKWEEVRVGGIQFEDTKAVVEALAQHLKLRLERREVFYGEPEYRFVPQD